MSARTSRPRPAPDAGRTTILQKILLVVFGLILFALLMVGVEVGLGLFGVGDPYLYEDPFVGFAPGRDLFSPKTLPDGRRVFATNPDKLGFFNQQQFPAEKSGDTYRVFAVGGSTTAGRPYDAQVAFARWLQLYLDDMDPSRRWEVINAGGISYASYRIVLLMKELVRYSPDLFVIYTGHNEFLEERTYSEIIHQSAAETQLRIWLGGLRSYTLARQAWNRVGNDPRSVPTTLDAEVSTRLDGWTGLDLYQRDEALAASVIAHFEFNLRQMIALARSHGADVVIVQPISNLKDFSPFKSEHMNGLGADQRRSFEALMARGRALLDSADAAEAEAARSAFEEALAIDPAYADTYFRLGRSYLALGRTDEARAAFVAAKDLDVAPLRALEEILGTIRAVANEYAVPLIDLPEILATAGGADIPGNEVLQDHVHPDIQTHSLIARRIVDVLIGTGVVAVDPAWTEESAAAVYAGVLDGIDPEYYAMRDLNLAKVLGWAGKIEEAEVPLLRAAELLDHDPEVHLNLGIVYQRTGRYEQALVELERAVALAPALPQAHFNLGVVYGHLERLEEGIAALRQALSLEPDYAEAYFDLGVLLRRHGAAEEALEAMDRALTFQPDSAAVHRNLGLVYRDLGRNEDAEQAFARALELDAGDLDSLTELAVTRARQGDVGAAQTLLAQVVGADPRHAKAHYNLGVVYSQQGMLDDAVAAYRQTLEIDPHHAEALNNLGILYARRGMMDQALVQLEHAVDVEPEYAEGHYNLGIVLDNLGRRRQARASLERAVALEPGNGSFHMGLATFLYGMGDFAPALEHFRRAADAGMDVAPELLSELARRTGR